MRVGPPTYWGDLCLLGFRAPRLIAFVTMCQDQFLATRNCDEGGRFVNKCTILSALVATLLAATAALAQNNPSNLERLGEFKTTGASPNIPTVPQGCGAEEE